MNTRSFTGSPGIIMQAVSLRGRAGLGAPASPRPRHLLCWAGTGSPAAARATALVVLLSRCGHRSLLGMDQCRSPRNTWPCSLCYWENSLGLRMCFIGVLWMQKNSWFGKASCGARTLLWKKHLFRILLYPCTPDAISCALPHAHVLLKEEQRLGMVTDGCTCSPLHVWW